MLNYPATLETLEGYVYERLLTQAGASHHITSEKVRLALNEAGREIHQQLLLLFEEQFFVVKIEVNPTGTQVLKPSDFERTLTFDRSSGTGWLPILLLPPTRYLEGQVWSQPAFENTTPAGITETWTEYPTFFEKNDAPPPTGPYRLIYQQGYVDLQTNTQVTVIPHQWQPAQVTRAAYFLARDADLPQQENLQQDYEIALARMKREASARNAVRIHRVRDVYGYAARRHGWW